LKSWMQGKGKILCATGALSAGINVKNIPLVIHCGLPWGISDFVQESGRGGRDGESVLSVIFLSEKEMSELRSNAGFAMEVQGIADFVTTDLCRRLVITRYMDGKSKRCVDLVDSIPCDNCQKAFDQSAEGQFKRMMDASFIPEEIRQVKFQKRITSQLSVLATNGERRSKIEKAARRLNGHCGACWLANNGVNYEHSYKKCRAAEQLLGLDSYVLYQSTVPKSGGIVCYRCRLPSTWCAGYKATDLNNMKNVCELTDAVSSMVAAGFVMKIEKVREMCGPIIKDLKEFMEWMQGVTELGGSKCTNALLVFEQLC
jgi:Helicase conserved C-terminal domain